MHHFKNSKMYIFSHLNQYHCRLLCDSSGLQATLWLPRVGTAFILLFTTPFLFTIIKFHMYVSSPIQSFNFLLLRHDNRYITVFCKFHLTLFLRFIHVVYNIVISTTLQYQYTKFICFIQRISGLLLSFLLP